MSFRQPLSQFLRDALAGTLPGGWLYLPDAELAPGTGCLLLRDEDLQDDEDPLPKAAQLGFPVEGLDTGSIEDVCASALALEAEASDALLVRAFDYYLRFDAFLPSADAPDPPSTPECILESDREFYGLLGEELPGTSCRREGCNRGAVRFSACCRKHHFENVQRRPCPFE